MNRIKKITPIKNTTEPRNSRPSSAKLDRVTPTFKKYDTNLIFYSLIIKETLLKIVLILLKKFILFTNKK